jgi:16S rRNA G966 N2-methylase RsmD
VRALRTTAERLGTTALETHCADALSYLARDRRSYDVVFLDPPFADSAWARLLPAAAARLAPEGRLYVESRAPIEPVEGLEILRRDKAGRVHYHLLRRAG